ncbi:hypothetical protein WKI71_35630 [Streptomyces sp. MS1.AVA.1]|uniref:Uncharacterized protein n=1 Tax=Streptomyces machairae TaxID=3134109 RepID=A0ABU8US68_9ACTN
MGAAADAQVDHLELRACAVLGPPAPRFQEHRGVHEAQGRQTHVDEHARHPGPPG